MTPAPESEDRAREQAALLDKAHDAIVTCDLDNRITYWNQGASRLYGWTAEEALGRDAIELLAVEAGFHHASRRRAIGRGEWRGELRHRTKGGGEALVYSSWTFIRRGGRAGDALLMINTDVTGKRRFEAQIHRAKRLESIGLMVGGLAHDLNNAFAPIVAGIETLVKAPAAAPNASLCENMLSSAKHGTALVRQLMEFARGAEGAHAETDVRAIAADIGPLIRSTLPRAIAVEIAITGEPPVVRADVTQLKQVLVNLCLNARDAMPDGGRITLEFGRAEVEDSDPRLGSEGAPGAHAVISVSDTGSGIAPEIMDRIFDPFFTTKEEGKGTGLGLSTVRGIVKGHGGFISVESEPGQGAVFRVFLPCAAQAPAPAPVAAAPARAESQGPGILLVDDEPAVLQTLALVLRSWGNRVFTATDGPGALAALSAHRDELQLAITDLQMGSMNGLELIRLLRGQVPDFPCIAISGYGDGGRFGRELEALHVPLIAKPIRRESLIGAVRAALNVKIREPLPA